jgi:hypothetical protein
MLHGHQKLLTISATGITVLLIVQTLTSVHRSRRENVVAALAPKAKEASLPRKEQDQKAREANAVKENAIVCLKTSNHHP